MNRALLALLVLTGCPKDGDVEAPVNTGSRTYSTPPAPLAPRSFQPPAVDSGALSNGIPVAVVENHEVPFVYVRVIFGSGTWSDPADRAGLASATMDMLNEGTEDYSADELSRALRRMASTLDSGAGLDGAAVSLTSLKQNLGPSLDLLAEVTLEPSFPAEDWSVMQAQRIQSVKAIPQNPRSISGRTWNRLVYGQEYAGKLSSVASYEAMTPGEMKGWYDQHITPDNTTILVGGDITLAEALPLLEERLGGWATQSTGRDELSASASFPAAETGRIYLVDKPGAAQSVVRLGQAVGDRQAPDATAFEMANMAIGGQFTARINMNLREDKGWTYGASAWVGHNHYPGIWNVYSSIVTPHTADGLREILSEIDGMSADAPITADELSAGQGDVLGSWPVRFEQPGYLLDRTVDVQRYGLPDDWLASYPDRVRAVTLEQAQQAWNSRIDPGNFIILVVGDAATIREPLEALGMPVVQLDIDGTPLTQE